MTSRAILLALALGCLAMPWASQRPRNDLAEQMESEANQAVMLADAFRMVASIEDKEARLNVSKLYVRILKDKAAEYREFAKELRSRKP